MWQKLPFEYIFILQYLMISVFPQMLFLELSCKYLFVYLGMSLDGRQQPEEAV